MYSIMSAHEKHHDKASKYACYALFDHGYW